MTLIVNPCENCTLYREQLVTYAHGIVEGEYEALEGIRTILDLAMSEERDPEMEGLLKQFPGICGENIFCIYERDDIEKLSGSLDKIRENVREMDIEERRIYLMANSLISILERESESSGLLDLI